MGPLTNEPTKKALRFLFLVQYGGERQWIALPRLLPGTDRIDSGPIFYTALPCPFLPFSVYICPPSGPARFWQYKVGKLPLGPGLARTCPSYMHISRPRCRSLVFATTWRVDNFVFSLLKRKEGDRGGLKRKEFTLLSAEAFSAAMMRSATIAC